MVALYNLALVLGLALFHLGVFSHPGEDISTLKQHRPAQHTVLTHMQPTLNHCHSSSATMLLKERAVARRLSLLKALRVMHGIADKPMLLRKKSKTDLEKWEAISHNVTSKGWNAGTPPSILFNTNSTTNLTPEQILGPYFISGELFRKDITEGQKGVKMLLELQLVEQNTCKAVPGMLVDIWHSNATGVYSGIAQTAGQGGLDTTWLRGFGRTNSEGVVQFNTIFPGHYGGRSNHIHILSSEGATLLSNGTYIGGKANHVGQLYFNQALNDAIEKLRPYNTNRQQHTANQDDGFAPSAATSKYDPFVSYVLLGEKVSDGLLAFITVGINQTAHYDIEPAVHWGEHGGEQCNDHHCD